MEVLRIEEPYTNLNHLKSIKVISGGIWTHNFIINSQPRWALVQRINHIYLYAIKYILDDIIKYELQNILDIELLV